MILVADRCGVSADYLVSMRESIVKAMQEYVELESEEAVEVCPLVQHCCMYALSPLMYVCMYI